MTEYNRVYNFSAGPSVLPLPVLEKVKEDLLNYQGSGQSVMEMSHRSTYFKKIIEDAEADLRELLNIPDNYKVLFLQGGGTLQFSMVPIARKLTMSSQEHGRKRHTKKLANSVILRWSPLQRKIILLGCLRLKKNRFVTTLTMYI